MSDDTVRFSAPLEVWTNEAENSSVAFVTLTADAAEQLSAHELARRLELGRRRGFGSVRVTVRVGGSEWQTSAFPMKGGDSWFLPIKVAICRAEGLVEGDCIEVELDLH
jgi:Domain of unknown function (DUF1905).